MGKVFFIADTHFGHPAIISPNFGTPRDIFESIAQHDATIIANWNAIVRPGDQVFHLGDFQHKCTPERTKQIFDRLHGDKHLVIGNHDKQHVLDLPWKSKPAQMAQIAVDGQRLFLCHYGMRTWPHLHRGVVHLYGHSHGTLPGTRHSQDVGVDNFGFRPVQFDEIRAKLDENLDIEGVARPDAGEPIEEETSGYGGP